eukprot:c24935_g1_i1 orf=45-1136(-)
MARLSCLLLLSYRLLFLCTIIALPIGNGHNVELSDTESADTPDLRSRGLVLVKIWCLIIAFFGTFIGGVSPYYLRWNDTFLVLGTQFAGGVFLGTAMMHFLSDSNSTFEDRTDKSYPFAFMLACFGYLVTMLGDCVIQWIFSKEVAAGRVDIEMPASLRASKVGIAGGDVCNCCHQPANACTCIEELPSETAEVRNIVKATLIRTTSTGDSILLIIALCFHSVFEGIAIGVAETQHDAWKALWTICLHKIFAAIAMGIALLRMIPNRPLLSCAIYSFLFAISSPVGVAIGIAIDATTEGPAADWIYAISMGFACGVFIYVAINHLLAKGYVSPCKIWLDTAFYKFLAVLLGITVIAIVMIWDT